MPGEAACVLITGMPGAGKTVVTRLLAKRFDRFAGVDAYFLKTLVRSGYVWALGEPADEAARQVELGNRNLAALAANFVDAGFTTVLDTVIPERAQYDLIAGLLAPRRMQVVVLAPGIEVCRERNRTREPEERFDFDDYESLEQRMHAALDGLALWLDTAQLSADETADLVADRVRATS